MFFLEIISTIFSPANLFLLAVGTLGGILVGAIPGLSGGMALALLASFTYAWGIEQALALMVGAWVGVVYGGSWSAILLNMPGAPSAIATTFDGYPLARQGKAGTAIGLATAMSFIGGLCGLFVLAIAAPPIKNIALRFGSHEYFVLVLVGLTLVGSLAGKHLSRGIVSASLGVIFGLVGMDFVYGFGRFTFSNPYLIGGIHFIPILIGLFCISEVLFQLGSFDAKQSIQNIGRVIPELKMVLKNIPLTIRSSLMGIFCGTIPGLGADLAALLSYEQAKQTVKRPSAEFGKGAYEGVIAAESANNACVGGTLIPMLTLGVPGDVSTAIMMGVMLMHGLRPGPLLMVEASEFYWLILFTMIAANFFMLIYGLTLVNLCARVVMVRKEILFPLIIVLAVVGSYTVEYNPIHMIFMLFFGILGYLMKLYSFPVGAMVLGVILAPLLDMSFRRAIVISGNSFSQFLTDLFTRPISLILLIILFLALLTKFQFIRNSFNRVFRNNLKGE